ncbi:ER membrane protein complex subunit 4-like protein [Drosera capensis]
MIIFLIHHLLISRPAHTKPKKPTPARPTHLLSIPELDPSACLPASSVLSAQTLNQSINQAIESRSMEKGKGVMGRRWAVEFTDNSSSSSSRDVADPPGFNRASHDQDDGTVSRGKKDAEANWKAQKAWEVAQAPVKNFLMLGFMMWMAGSTVHLFSIGITFSALWQPISALQGVGKVFEPFKDNKVDLLGPKLVYIALNVVALGVGVWKLNTLGLLPTHISDWVSSLPPAQEVEFSGGGIPFQR